MKPFTEYTQEDSSSSFYYRHFTSDSLNFRWHHHSKYEITLIAQGNGTRYVGDSIEQFESDDLIMMGPYLPHTWYSRTGGEIFVIQFREDFLGKTFSNLPEMVDLKVLFENSRNGLVFGKRTVEIIKKKLLQLEDEKSIKKMLLILEILELLASASDVQKLSKQLFKISPEEKKINRIDKVCSYLNENFNRKIILYEVAEIAAMSPNSFCRFFKGTTGKSFTDYLIDLRIGTACKLLIETDLPISQIAYNSGFSNLSNFNRKFLGIKNVSPRDYRKEYEKHSIK